VLVDFTGANLDGTQGWERGEVVAVAKPYLDEAAGLGAKAFIECTPTFLGRDPELLRELSQATGLHILTNTGYYGGQHERFIAKEALKLTAPELAERWVKEWRDGIDGTGVRPGFIKTAVGGASETHGGLRPLTELDQRLIRAAALAHLQTGLTIACHTANADGLAQLDILEAEGVSASAWIWVHANHAPIGRVIEAAKRGAWVSFDGLNEDNVDVYVQTVQAMIEAGLLERVLLSHDAGWYTVGEANGGDYRGYSTLFKRLLPALRDAGVTQAQVDTLVVGNPAQAFAVRVRSLNE
jgi:phosphotriesterase-related protein